MPFKSDKQRKFLHANEPEVAKSWEQEAKSKGQPAVRPSKKKSKAKQK